ncbi:MAG: MmgE/PrpD family protein [Proteobacteria bacterium]|nr:MmgE/PrpD family protein [Pseudomonadota bacterium]
MSLSEDAVRWYLGLGLERVPPAVIAGAKEHVLDVLGLALVATTVPLGRAVREGALGLGAGGEARLLGTGERVPAATAALVNGTLVHAMDFDDTHNVTMLHNYGPLTAVALALGEARGIGGAELLAAIIGGNEVAYRIALAAPMQFHRSGFHPTGVVGTLAAAMAAGRLLGLDAEKVRHAVGIAGSQAAGLLESYSDGTWVKTLHPGWAAHSGIAAALLARAGFTGPATVIEGRFGLFRAHVQDPAYELRFERVMEGIGERWECEEVSFKPYPNAHVIHPFIDAVLHLHRQEGLKAEMVERIVLPIHASFAPVVCEPRALKLRPRTDTHARASLPYSVAAALVLGRMGIEAYAPETLADPAVLALAERIEHEIDPSPVAPGQYRGWVKVRTRDGRALERIEPHNWGSRKNPFTAADVERKFRDNAGRALPAGRLDAIVAAVRRLERLPTASALVDLCVG